MPTVLKQAAAPLEPFGLQIDVKKAVAGVPLLGWVFNLLNFQIGLGFISLSAYWQSVIRGVFLLLVIVLQACVLKQRGKKRVAAA
jgi:ribose transport system permease protein